MSSPTPLYLTLQRTSTAFIHALNPSKSSTNQAPHTSTLAALCTIQDQNPFALTFGPPAFVANTPHLQTIHTLESWMAQISSMSAALETWEVQVDGEVVVDEVRLETVVRARFVMVVAGEGEKGGRTVVHGVLFLLGFREEGGGVRVKGASEWVDPFAVGRIGELVRSEGERRGRGKL